MVYLLADADRNFREALAIALRLDGHEVVAAGSSEEALAALKGGRVRCCVVDAHLLGADGLLTAATDAGLRAVITGTYADLVEHAARRHPRAEMLPKPFRAAELAGEPAVP